MALSGSSNSNTSACNAGDLGSIPGLGRSTGEGHGNSFQNSCLENSMDKGGWSAIMHGVVNSQTEELTHTHTHKWRYKRILRTQK